jgi:hypothetical protein
MPEKKPGLSWDEWGSYNFEKRSLCLHGEALDNGERGYLIPYLSSWIWVAVTMEEGVRSGIASTVEDGKNAIMRANRRLHD